MVSYVKNYIQDQAMGYLHTGITAAGTMAGNAVGGVGGLIENGGRSIGEGIAGSINGVGGYINNYGDGIRNKFAADGYVGASASQKAKREPSEATKPYGLKRLPDASAPGNMVTNASRKVLPASMQPKPSAAATKQVRSGASKPVGAVKKVPGATQQQKALPAPSPRTKPPPPKTTNARSASAPPAKPIPGPPAGRNAALKPPGRTATPKPVQPKPASAGINTNKPPVSNGKTKISAASRPKKKPIPA